MARQAEWRAQVPFSFDLMDAERFGLGLEDWDDAPGLPDEDENSDAESGRAVSSRQQGGARLEWRPPLWR